ncbi:DUF2945 domain-containing protein [Aureimonas altamirensis]|uniref:DUF2945 domain-containing protein n=1 Tax=Aureimonas altamirensis TaxID=370622 RepID=UPI00301762AE
MGCIIRYGHRKRLVRMWVPAATCPGNGRLPLGLPSSGTPKEDSAMYRKGSKVTWSWGNGTAEGRVEEKFTEKVTRKIAGKSITRNADKDNPAYLVVQEDGAKALKSESELSKG